MYTRILGFVLLGIGLFSCNSPSILHEESFSDGCWDMGDTLTWSPGTSLEGNLTLFVEFTDEYAYRNLFVKVWTKAPGRPPQDSLWQAVVVDSLGYWMAPLVNNQRIRYVFPQNFWEGEKIPSQVKVVQYMRDSLLCGIERVGIIREGSK